MASAVRVLPALIAVSIGVLAFKGVDIYEAVAQVVEGDAAPKPETELTAGVGDRPSETATEAAAQGAGAPSPQVSHTGRGRPCSL